MKFNHLPTSLQNITVFLVAMAAVTILGSPAIAVDNPTAPIPAEVVQVDPPPVRHALLSDDVYQAEFVKFLRTEPAKDSPDHDKWLSHAASLANYAREYARAEAFDRMRLVNNNADPFLHASLSVMLGKQGKYREALAEIEQALALPSEETDYMNAVKASWLYHVGKREAAKALFASITPPKETDKFWSRYHGCRACFGASTGNLPMMQESIRVKVQLGGWGAAFIQRDVIFDQYRHQDWFKAMVGETLVPVL